MSADVLAGGWAKVLGGDRKQFNMFIEKMLDGFAYHKIVLDKAGKPIDYVFLEVNYAFEKMTGLKRAQIIGKKVTEVLMGIEKDPADWIGVYGHVALTGEPVEFENHAVPLGKWYRVSAYCPEKGYFVALFEDITERKKAEEAMAFQANLLSRAREAIFGVDSKYNITYWNKGAEDLFGYTKEEAMGKNFQELIPIKLEGSSRAEELAKQEATGYWEGEVQYRRKDSSYVLVELNSATLKSPTGELLGVVTAARDITERKKAEESTARQAELIDLSPDAIIVRKLYGTITFWSKGAEKLYGWTKDEAIGQDMNSLLKPEFSQHLEEIIDQLKLEGKWSGEIVHLCKDGSKVAEQSFWLARLGVDGEIFEVVESNVDITERVELQVKLEESAVRVEEYANQMEELAEKRAAQLKDAERLATIGATAGMVGHDIRNPLQAITGDVFLAKTDLIAIPESEEKKNIQESLSEIEKNVDYINKIVADLQDFARPLRPNAEETDLKLIINDLLKKNGLPENVKVTVKVETDAIKVVADSTFINRIMYNLVTNAVQAMPNGGKLTIHAYKEEKDILIAVKDTGVGIPEKVKGKLFTPMFTTKSKGQGFGLAVIKRMSESLGGTVTFESEEGKGTTFIIRLPPPKELNGKLAYKQT